MDRPRRTHAEARAQMREGILRLGNEQLAQRGASELSVREIARGLGVASSAIYRHVSGRDELLTLLIVDAYEDLAAAALAGCRAAEASAPGAQPGECLARLARGMRGWALANPSRWALAYGSPVPGYIAPADRTTGPGTRVMAAFIGVLATGQAPADARAAQASSGLAADLAEGSRELGITTGPVDTALAAAAVEAWTGLIGLISAEMFQQLGPEFAMHGEELLERWLASTFARFGMV